MATNHIQVSVGGSRQADYAALSKLAETLGCRITDIAWAGIAYMLKNPPKDLQGMGVSRSATSTGSARGFWIQHTTDAIGKLTSAKVVEVASRGAATGALFLRYAQGDAKGRVRVLNQAVKSAAYDCSLAGIKDAKIAVTELKDKEGVAKVKVVAPTTPATPAVAATPAAKK